MEIKTEELIAKIKQSKEKQIAAKQQETERRRRQYEVYQNEFYKLADRINNLIQLGKQLMESGLPLGERYEECGFYYEKLKTDSVHHNIGFVVSDGLIEGIGIKGGGCYGRDLCVDSDGKIIKGMPKKYCDDYNEGEQKKMQKLLDNFIRFEVDVVDYINRL